LSASGVKADLELARSVTELIEDVPLAQMPARTVRIGEIFPASKSVEIEPCR